MTLQEEKTYSLRFGITFLVGAGFWLYLHSVITSKFFDLLKSGDLGLATLFSYTMACLAGLLIFGYIPYFCWIALKRKERLRYPVLAGIVGVTATISPVFFTYIVYISYLKR